MNYKFEVLYTKDIHKKSQNRKWIDGYAELNTSSKKMTVYDDETRQYVVSSILKSIDFDVHNPDGAEKRLVNYEIQLVSLLSSRGEDKSSSSSSSSNIQPSQQQHQQQQQQSQQVLSSQSQSKSQSLSNYSSDSNRSVSQLSFTKSGRKKFLAPRTLSKPTISQEQQEPPSQEFSEQQSNHFNQLINNNNNNSNTNHRNNNNTIQYGKRTISQQQQQQWKRRGIMNDDDDDEDGDNDNSSTNQQRMNMQRTQSYNKKHNQWNKRNGGRNDDDDDVSEDNDDIDDNDTMTMNSRTNGSSRQQRTSRDSQISLRKNNNSNNNSTVTSTTKENTESCWSRQSNNNDQHVRSRYGTKRRFLNDDDDGDDDDDDDIDDNYGDRVAGIAPEDKVEVVTVVSHSGRIRLDDEDDDFDFNPSPARNITNRQFKPVSIPKSNSLSNVTQYSSSSPSGASQQASPSNNNIHNNHNNSDVIDMRTPKQATSSSPVVLTKGSPNYVSSSSHVLTTTPSPSNGAITKTFRHVSPPSLQKTPISNNNSNNLSSNSNSSTPSPNGNSKFTPPTAKKFSPPLARSPQSSASSIDTNLPILSLMQQFIGRRDTVWFPNSTVCNSFLQSRASPKRSVLIPNKFNNIEQYKSVFLSAVYEDMNLQMYKIALKYRRAYKQITGAPGMKQSDSAPAKMCPHGKMVLKTVKKEGPNKGRVFYSCPTQNSGCKVFHWANSESASNAAGGSLVRHISNAKERMSFFRSSAISYYCNCEFSQSQNMLTKSFKSKSSTMKYKSTATQWYLRIDDKEQGSPYAKDDIWIISNDETFDSENSLLICRSVFHGPTSDGSIEVLPLYGKPGSISTSRSVYAIRGPNLASELEMIENLETLNKTKLPILESLLGNPTACSEDTALKSVVSFDIGVPKEEVIEKAEKFIAEYELNEDQAEVIRNSAKWFIPTEYCPDIHLVHGVFGAGKSFMLVVLILFLCELLDEAGNTDIRIMISSVTNVAVDRVLQGLITENCDNVLRVGSQRKIARAILPYTLISDKSKQDIVRDLNQMLKKSLDPQELIGVKKALKDVQSGALEKKKDSVKSVRVVGVTCAASAFEVLKGNKFPIMIIDESSQCVEPLALLPMARFGCQKLIAVGDPQQLSPTLSGSFGRDDPDSLEKTLFIRLSEVGFIPQMLRTQYRCHPQISALSNKMFYGGMLMDGIKASDRPPLIYGMPPVFFVDVPNGKEQAASDGSFSNEEEVNCVVSILKLLTQNESVTKDTIGVISLYRSQKFQLKLALKKNGVKGIKISTVDAFQGGERDIIILTSCRTTNNLSFIENEKRLNVALSRAKKHLIIVGKQETLDNSKYWRNVILQAERSPNGISSWRRIRDILQIHDLFQTYGSSRSYVAPRDMDDEEEVDFDKPLYEQTLPKRQLLQDDDDSDDGDDDDERQAEYRNAEESMSMVANEDDPRFVVDREEGEMEFDFGEEAETGEASSASKKRSLAQLIDDDDNDDDGANRIAVIPSSDSEGNSSSSPEAKRRRLEDCGDANNDRESSLVKATSACASLTELASDRNEDEDEPMGSVMNESTTTTATTENSHEQQQQGNESIVFDTAEVADDNNNAPNNVVVTQPNDNVDANASSNENKNDQSIELDLDW